MEHIGNFSALFTFINTGILVYLGALNKTAYAALREQSQRPQSDKVIIAALERQASRGSTQCLIALIAVIAAVIPFALAVWQNTETRAMRKQIQDLTNESADARGQISQLTTSNNLLVTSSLHLRAAVENQGIAISNRLVDLGEKTRLIEQLNSVSGQKDILRSELETKFRHVTDLNRDLEKSNSILVAHLKDLDSDFTVRQDALISASNSLSTMKIQLQVARDEVIALQSGKSTQEKDASRLQAEVNRLAAELTNTLTTASSVSNRLQGDLAAATTKLSIAEKTADMAALKISGQEAALQSLRASLAKPQAVQFVKNLYDNANKMIAAQDLESQAAAAKLWDSFSERQRNLRRSRYKELTFPTDLWKLYEGTKFHEVLYAVQVSTNTISPAVEAVVSIEEWLPKNEIVDAFEGDRGLTLRDFYSKYPTAEAVVGALRKNIESYYNLDLSNTNFLDQISTFYLNRSMREVVNPRQLVNIAQQVGLRPRETTGGWETEKQHRYLVFDVCRMTLIHENGGLRLDKNVIRSHAWAASR